MKLLFISMLFSFTCHSQATQYKDFCFDGKQIWAVTKTGKLAAFDLHGKPILKNIPSDSAIVAINCDKNGALVIADSSTAIKQYNLKSKTWKTLFHCNGIVMRICFTSKNKCYLITEKGIFDPSSKSFYFPDSLIQGRYRGKWQGRWGGGSCSVVDNNDNIWSAFYHGEWGGELFIFNTLTKSFIAAKDHPPFHFFYPVQSIFTMGNEIILSRGHRGGEIIRYTKFSSTLLLETKSEIRTPNFATEDDWMEGYFVGPGAYNPHDHCIYFCTQYGIYKGNPKKDLSKIEYWTKVFKPVFHAPPGLIGEYDASYDLTKMQFVKRNIMVFLTINDGIGIYDGKKVIAF